MTSASVAHNIKEKPRTGDVIISENITFDGLFLSENILKGLKSAGFERPSPIQLKAIPLGRCGLDLIVQAKSGTGKTCVFSVIALEGLQLDSSAIQVLILAPTREIAIQIWDVIKSIGQALPQLKCHTFIGGMPIQEDKQKLKKCHIAVGTPGRIKQLIEHGMMSIENIRMFILDEADKLLEESFQEQINWIYSTLPDNKQMLALSATYPEYLAEHLTAYMRNPTFLRLNVSDPALLGIKQYYTTVKFHPLPNKLFERKVEAVTHILTSVEFQQCLIFSNLQTMAQNTADALNAKGWPTACIAGCLDQKDRNTAMEKLKSFQCRVLISTDLTSRGIDADKVNLVINLDVPKDHETYLHRIGRAGRFGSFGGCISIISEGQEQTSLQAVEKKCNTNISVLPDPIPVDLVKSSATVCLDDMVSTEKIFNDNQRKSPIKSPKKADIIKAVPFINGNEQESIGKPDTDIVRINTSNDSATLSKSSPKDVTDTERSEIHMKVTKDSHGSRIGKKVVNGLSDDLAFLNSIKSKKDTVCKTLNLGKVKDSDLSAKMSDCKEETTCSERLNLPDNENSPEKLTKIKSKPKSHKTANFWTELIEERNDDEDFVREFNAYQDGEDIFGDQDYLEEINEISAMKQDKVETVKDKLQTLNINDEDESSENETILKQKSAGCDVVDEQINGKVKGQTEQKLSQAHVSSGNGEVLRRKSARRIDKDVQKQTLTKETDALISEDVPAEVVMPNIESIDLEIPPLEETIGFTKLKKPHTYKSALESFESFKENLKGKTSIADGKENTLVDEMEKVKILDDPPFAIKVGKLLKYDQELLNKVKDILSMKPLPNKLTNVEKDIQSINGVGKTSSKSKDNLEKKETKQQHERKAIKATRIKRKAVDQKFSPQLSLTIEKQGNVDISPKENVIGNNYTDKDLRAKSHDAEELKISTDPLSVTPKEYYDDFWNKLDRVDYDKKGAYKNKKSAEKDPSGMTLAKEKNQNMKSRTNNLPNRRKQVDYDQTEDYRKTEKSIFKSKSNCQNRVYEDLSESEISEFSESSDTLQNKDRKYNKGYGSRKSKGKQYGSYSHKDSKLSPESSDTSLDSESDENPWEYYMKNYQKYYRAQANAAYQQQNPYMNMHQYPYMNMQQFPFMNMQHYPYMAAANPYMYSNPWTGQFNQTNMMYQHLYKNLETQQKYIQKMMKHYRKCQQ